MRKAVFVMLVASMLVFAGCMGNGGGEVTDGEDANTVDDENLSTEDGGDSTEQDGSDSETDEAMNPSWMTEDGVNSSSLVNSFNEEFSSKSYRMRIDYTVETSIQEKNFTYNMTGRIEKDSEGNRMMVLSFGGIKGTQLESLFPSELSVWLSSDGTTYAKAVRGGEAEYSKGQNGKAGQWTFSNPMPETSRIQKQLSEVQTVEKTTFKGTTVWKIFTEGKDQNGEYRNTVFVDSKGMFRKMELNMLDRRGSKLNGVITITDVGSTSLNKPGWTTKAEE